MYYDIVLKNPNGQLYVYKNIYSGMNYDGAPKYSALKNLEKIISISKRTLGFEKHVYEDGNSKRRYFEWHEVDVVSQEEVLRPNYAFACSKCNWPIRLLTDKCPLHKESIICKIFLTQKERKSK